MRIRKHVLEHLSHEDAKLALSEMNRVLKPEGELLLFIPDLSECCTRYVEAENKQVVNGFLDKEWYKYTIFGKVIEGMEAVEEISKVEVEPTDRGIYDGIPVKPVKIISVRIKEENK